MTLAGTRDVSDVYRMEVVMAAGVASGRCVYGNLLCTDFDNFTISSVYFNIQQHAMGIKGIYHEIGPGDRIALSRLAVETYEEKGRPLRLAIDISIWLFQIQSGKGGTNPALRTFFYRLLRLISLCIHPLFVFDGPNKPPFKRNKRTGPNVASIPEFLAKQLLKQFGLPFHLAPGEAEAECALLQQKGIVDAVLSEDVDTLMFGSGMTLRNWSAEGTLKSKTATHINVYDSDKTKAGSGLDRPGMILVALMSGGDYIPEGIPGCGPKTACEAARAGFGEELYQVKEDKTRIAQWKERLVHELRTNESKFFRAKHKALVIPDDFPRRDVLRYYTDPCVSSDERLDSLRSSLKWDQDIDLPALREFTLDAFKWEFISGAKHFIRNLAPALLVQKLRLRADLPPCDDTCLVAQQEACLVQTIHQTRQHITTDNTTEIRIGYVPLDLVDIDLEAEDPDPELPLEGLESDDEDMATIGEEPGSPKKKRTPRDYDPTGVEKIWILETWIRVGVPLKIQDHEESFRSAKLYEQMKATRKEAEGIKKKTTKKTSKKAEMPAGSLDRFTKVTKAGICKPKARSKSPTEEIDMASGEAERALSVPPMLNAIPLQKQHIDGPKRPAFRLPAALPPPSSSAPGAVEVLDLSLSPNPQATKKQRVLRRSQSETMPPVSQHLIQLSENIEAETMCHTPIRNANRHMPSIRELSPFVATRRPRSPIRRTKSIPTPPTPLAARPSTPPPPAYLPQATQILKKTPTPKRKRQAVVTEVITLSSSPATTPSSRQQSITAWLSPGNKASVEAEPPDSPSPRRNMRHATENDLQINLVRFSPPPPPPPLRLFLAKESRMPMSESDGNVIFPGVDLRTEKEASEVVVLSDPVFADTYASDSGDELPPFPLPLPVAYSSAQALRHTSMTTTASIIRPAITASLRSQSPAADMFQTSNTMAAPPPSVPQQVPTPLAVPDLVPRGAEPRFKRIIRIRDSLAGAWAEEDVIDLASSPLLIPTVAAASAAEAEMAGAGEAKKMSGGKGETKKGSKEKGNGRKGRGSEKQRTKEWRVSQVEVLDLS